MKVLALFDESGKIHALFHASTKPDAPQFRFQPAKGHRAETLEVPAALSNLEPAKLHTAVKVDLSGATPRLVAR
jgi:hypothetical protein